MPIILRNYRYTKSEVDGRTVITNIHRDTAGDNQQYDPDSTQNHLSMCRISDSEYIVLPLQQLTRLLGHFKPQFEPELLGKRYDKRFVSLKSQNHCDFLVRRCLRKKSKKDTPTFSDAAKRKFTRMLMGRRRSRSFQQQQPEHRSRQPTPSPPHPRAAAPIILPDADVIPAPQQDNFPKTPTPAAAPIILPDADVIPAPQQDNFFKTPTPVAARIVLQQQEETDWPFWRAFTCIITLPKDKKQEEEEGGGGGEEEYKIEIDCADDANNREEVEKNDQMKQEEEEQGGGEEEDDDEIEIDCEDDANNREEVEKNDQMKQEEEEQGGGEEEDDDEIEIDCEDDGEEEEEKDDQMKEEGE
ncbi:sodium/potassium/calcium exchanger 1-like [Littorina saxatilis]|uniref:sodium/potassium/calcium exchanger 1-like n=1 Tax=Littorina saxatilis TaxID=31220 RepID=UPI0038B431DF